VRSLAVFALAGMLALSMAQARSAKPPVQIVPEKQRQCTGLTPSGLGYKMLREGSGAVPVRDEVALVDYIGYFAKTGAIFDQGIGIGLRRNGVVPGFGEGLGLLRTGGIIRLCLPWKLGYGAAGAGTIPPRADLVFQVQLRQIMTPDQHRDWIKAQRENQRRR
jgi:FKBP-type peptidyl-prolyl cis-trans isomerase FkpA